MKPLKPFEFVVPSSTANLGPGFGVLGLALDMTSTVRVTDSALEGIVVERPGTDYTAALDVRHDALVRSLHATTERWSTNTPKGLSIVVEESAPRDCGLGTNSADFATGIGIALRFAKQQPEPDEVLELLVQLGGDPGHGAAALFGGLALAIPDAPHNSGQRFRTIRAPIDPAWSCIIVAPKFDVTTADARRVVPASLAHGIVSRTSGRLVGLLRALETSDEDMLRFCLVDESHVPFRLAVVPGMAEAIDAAVGAGAAGATISGHGPAIIALTTDDGKLDDIAHAACAAFESAGTIAQSWNCKPSAVGALPGDGDG